MLERYKKENSALAQVLVMDWSEKYVEYTKLRKEMNDLQQRMVNEFARHKIGDIVRDTKDGKRYVVTKVTVSEFDLRGGVGGKESQIAFEYTLRAIRKDGLPSLNNSLLYGATVEPTGEHINLED